MYPKFTKVDNATSFLTSLIKHPTTAPKTAVQAPNISNSSHTPVPNQKSRIWYSKKTPAVTNVEEWTKEETGVGAIIAAGSHLQ